MTTFDGLPTSLRIGPFDVAVEIVDKVFDDDAWGAYVHGKQLIQLKSEMPSKTFAIETVLHEINHAVYSLFELRKKDCEERIVSTLAAGWTQVFRDNPRLLLWLSSAVSEAP